MRRRGNHRPAQPCDVRQQFLVRHSFSLYVAAPPTRNHRAHDCAFSSILREHLYEQNDVTLALARCSSTVDRFGRMPQDAINDRSLYPAFRFAAQVLSLMDSTDTKRANQIARRVHGAFRNPDEMRAMQFELGMATHFIRRGHAVASPEMNGTGRFDFLIDNLGAGGLEIECKSASVDKGTKNPSTRSARVPRFRQKAT